MLKSVFLEEGKPRWNKMFTKEAMLEAWGYSYPDDRHDRKEWSRLLSAAIGRYRKADTHIVSLESKDGTAHLDAFVTVRIGVQWVWGYTSNAIVAALNFERRFKVDKGRVESSWLLVRNMANAFDETAEDREFYQKLIDSAEESYTTLMEAYAVVMRQVSKLPR